MQRYAADDLHVEVAEPRRAHRRLTDGGKGLRKEVVERLPLGIALAEPRGRLAELGVAHGLELRLELVDARGNLLKLPELSVGYQGEDF